MSESEMFPANSNWEEIAKYGDFQLLHSGSYADTYRARKAGKYFLLKTPKSDNTAFLDILKREYEVSVGLDHPNITSAFTFEFIPEIGACLVMEYVDGENLSGYLSHKPGAESRKKTLSQLLSAVGYLHKRNIIHNDLKPENIIISRQEGNLKLIDFGLSDDEVHYLTKTLGCTPGYASPELQSGQGPIDARSDIYSLGKLIKLIFPVRYALISKKCSRKNPSSRFRSTETISRAIKTRRVINFILPLLLALGIWMHLALPGILQSLEYDAAIAEAETMFKSQCSIEDIVAGDIPHVSRSSYFEFSKDKSARKDSLASIMSTELEDRIVRRDGIEKLDSLYNAYADAISNEPYEIFGMFDVARFVKEYNGIRDTRILLFQKEICKNEFYSYSEKKIEESKDSLYKIVHSLPDYSNLPCEEIEFYNSLALSGLPYRPFRK